MVGAVPVQSTKEKDPRDICKGQRVFSANLKMPLEALRKADLSTYAGKKKVFDETEKAWGQLTKDTRENLLEVLGGLFEESFEAMSTRIKAACAESAESAPGRDAAVEKEKKKVDYAELASEFFKHTELGLLFTEIINNYLEHGFQFHVHNENHSKVCASSDRQYMKLPGKVQAEESAEVILPDGTNRPGKTPEQILDDYIEGLQSAAASEYEAYITVFVDSDQTPPVFGLVVGDSNEADVLVDKIAAATRPDLTSPRGRGLFLIKQMSSDFGKLAGVNRMGVKINLDIDELAAKLATAA